MGCAAIAVLVAARVDALPLLLPHLTGWDTVIASRLADNVHGMWRVMRGGIKYLLAAGLFILILFCARDLVVHGRRRSAAVAIAVAVAAYGTVELVKAVLVPSPAWVAEAAPWHVMSGHVAAAAATAVPVLAATRRARGWVAVLAVLVIAGTGAGVVLARWHTVADGLASMVVVVVWAVVSAAVVRTASRGRASGQAAAYRSTRSRLGAAGALLAGVAVMVLATVTPSTGHVTTGMIAAAALLAGAGLVSVAAALELGAALAQLDGGPTARERES